MTAAVLALPILVTVTAATEVILGWLNPIAIDHAIDEAKIGRDHLRVNIIHYGDG